MFFAHAVHVLHTILHMEALQLIFIFYLRLVLKCGMFTMTNILALMGLEKYFYCETPYFHCVHVLGMCSQAWREHGAHVHDVGAWGSPCIIN